MTTTRLTATALHIAISLGLFGLVAVAIVQFGYPGFLLTADGGAVGLRTVLLVTLAAGPLLTLMVFKPGKRGLKGDLVAIGLFQLVCLAGGSWVVWSERPLALVYSDGTFFSLAADDFDAVDMPRDRLGDLPGPWPKRAAVVLPGDFEAIAKARLAAIHAHTPLHTHAEYYEPLAAHHLDFQQEAVAPEHILRLSGAEAALGDWIANHGGALVDYAFFRFATRFHYAFLGVRRATGELIDWLPVEIPTAAGEPTAAKSN